MQKRNKTKANGDRPMQRIAVLAVILRWHSIQPHMDAYAESLSRAESDSAGLVLNGDNMLGLCDPSNLLFEYSFYPPRSEALFSNYFEDLLLLARHSTRVGQKVLSLTTFC